MWIFFSTRVTGIVLTEDIGIVPKAIMERGFTFPPIEYLEPSSMCPAIFAMSLRDIGTSRMEMSERTGRHGKGIGIGKGTEEGNGMARTGGNPTGKTTIGEEAEGGTAINPFLASASERSGEIIRYGYFSRAVC